jgi:hypothetical protein
MGLREPLVGGGLAGLMRPSPSGCPQILWVILAMLLGSFVVLQGFAGLWIGVLILWAMAGLSGCAPSPCGSRPTGFHPYRKGTAPATRERGTTAPVCYAHQRQRHPFGDGS